jgi:hypothetical protein
MKIDPLLILVTPTGLSLGVWARAMLCYRVDPNCLLLLQPNLFFWSIHSPFLSCNCPGCASCTSTCHPWQGWSQPRTEFRAHPRQGRATMGVWVKSFGAPNLQVAGLIWSRPNSISRVTLPTTVPKNPYFFEDVHTTPQKTSLFFGCANQDIPTLGGFSESVVIFRPRSSTLRRPGVLGHGRCGARHQRWHAQQSAANGQYGSQWTSAEPQGWNQWIPSGGGWMGMEGTNLEIETRI